VLLVFDRSHHVLTLFHIAAASRIPLYQGAQTMPAPAEPPEKILTEQDRQAQQQYEQWLEQQNVVVEQQKKHYEAEVAKLRKIRKVFFYRTCFCIKTQIRIYS
jgi:hypothetical protein